MIALLGFILIGLCSLVASSVFAFRNQKWQALLVGGFGLFCLAAIAIIILALSHFGEAPRD